jgi:hypothetical protein
MFGARTTAPDEPDGDMKEGVDLIRTTDTRTVHPHVKPPRWLLWAVLAAVACGPLFGDWWRYDDSSEMPRRADVPGNGISVAEPAVTETTQGRVRPLAVLAGSDSAIVPRPDARAAGHSVLNSLAAASTHEYQTDVYERELRSADSLAHTIMQTHTALREPRARVGQSQAPSPSRFTIPGRPGSDAAIVHGMDP